MARTAVPLTGDEVSSAVVFAATATDNCRPDQIQLRPR